MRGVLFYGAPFTDLFNDYITIYHYKLLRPYSLKRCFFIFLSEYFEGIFIFKTLTITSNYKYERRQHYY